MTNLSCKVLSALAGKTLVSAESCTGGGIGHWLTCISGSSSVYNGGIISYTNWVKHNILGVDDPLIETLGPVSGPVAKAMAEGARRVLEADVAVSVTGLAGPGADEYGYPVGTVFIGYADEKTAFFCHCNFSGDREAVRDQTIQAALELVLEQAQM